jgi:hypothetical protein
MGSQQLLLITLGTIVVALAVYSGINMASSYFEDHNREQVINILQNLSTMAQEYYKKPAEAGGGGGSYQGFEIPNEFSNSEVGTFNCTANKNRARIRGKGTVTGNDGQDKINVIVVVEPGNIEFQIRN